MMCRIIMVILMVACIVVLGVSRATATGFQDILDQPAMKGKQVVNYLYNGIVSAGDRLVSVGQYGAILYSDDKGKSWIQAEVPVSASLTAVVFPTPKKGWAVGEDGIVLHSEDGGTTWIKQFDGKVACQVLSKYYTANPPKNLGTPDVAEKFKSDLDRIIGEGPDKPFLDVCFENETTGFIIGGFNMIFRTEDGGKSWVPWLDRLENPRGLHLYSMKFIDGDTFIAGEQGLLLKLDHKTSRFLKVNTPYPGSYFGVLGKRGAMIVFGMRGNLYRSADKGATWKKIETGLSSGLTGGVMTKDGRIIIVSQGGDVIMSNSEYTEFNKVQVGTPFSGAAVETVGNDSIVVAGFGGLKVLKLK